MAALSTAAPRRRPPAPHLAPVLRGHGQAVRVPGRRPADPRARRGQRGRPTSCSETGTGLTVPPDDVEAITGALLQVGRGGPGGSLPAARPRALPLSRPSAEALARADRARDRRTRRRESGRRATAWSRSPPPPARSNRRGQRPAWPRPDPPRPGPPRRCRPAAGVRAARTRRCPSSPNALVVVLSSMELEAGALRAPAAAPGAVKCTRWRGRSRWYQREPNRRACAPPKLGTVTSTSPPGRRARGARARGRPPGRARARASAGRWRRRSRPARARRRRGSPRRTSSPRSAAAAAAPARRLHAGDPPARAR